MLSRIINRLRRYFPQNTRKVFRSIYKKNAWNSDESISGPGSTLLYTETLRSELPQLLRSLKVKTMLDAPCGDLNWISQVDLGNIQYTGVDIVPEIIKANKLQFPAKKFLLANIIRDPLPAADLVLCRDCFIHLRNEEITRVLQNFRNSNIKYLLASTYPVDSNKWTLTGHFRPVNLEIEPFNLKSPITKLRDYPEGEPERYLGLWNLT